MQYPGRVEMICAVQGCTNGGQLIRGWCKTHHSRWLKHGDVQANVPIARKTTHGQTDCSITGCGRPHLARGWCATHYQRWRATGSAGSAELLRVPSHPGATKKRCTICMETKPAADFYGEKRNRDGLMSHCKPCLIARQKPGRRRRKYGLEPDEYDALLLTQSGRCPICKEDRPLVVDHCHRSGKVRALLCGRCNCVLGFVDDNVAILRAAVEYLQQHTSKMEEPACQQ